MFRKLIYLLPLLLFVLPGASHRTAVYAQDYICTAPSVPFQPLSPTYDVTTGQLNQWLCIDPSTGKVTASGIGGGSPGGNSHDIQCNISSARSATGQRTCSFAETR